MNHDQILMNVKAILVAVHTHVTTLLVPLPVTVCQAMY